MYPSRSWIFSYSKEPKIPIYKYVNICKFLKRITLYAKQSWSYLYKQTYLNMLLFYCCCCLFVFHFKCVSLFFASYYAPLVLLARTRYKMPVGGWGQIKETNLSLRFVPEANEMSNSAPPEAIHICLLREGQTKSAA